VIGAAHDCFGLAPAVAPDDRKATTASLASAALDDCFATRASIEGAV
jgi:hypothetical protein